MSTNYPSAGSNGSGNQKDNKSNIIILLVILLVASWAYFFYARNEANQVIDEKDAQYAVLDSAKTAVQKEYDEAMFRINDLTSMNSRFG